MTGIAAGNSNATRVSCEFNSLNRRDQPLLSIFTIPKPFVGRDDVIQRNAIGSWLQSTPGHQIVLFGEVEGTARVAAELGVSHVARLSQNEFGTPFVSEAFATVAERPGGEYLLYANSDIIFPDSLATTVQRLKECANRPFLAIGRRVNVNVDRLIDWRKESDVSWLKQCQSEGNRESILCKDYFLYPRGWFTNLPPFAVGRGNWDNWMVFAAKKMKLMVVDLSASVIALHQAHDHDHVRGGRSAAYVRGPEARANQRLAGGRHWIRGSTSDWRLDGDRLKSQRWSGLQLAFWADLPRIAKLGWDIYKK